jgi:TonB family protein
MEKQPMSRYLILVLALLSVSVGAHAQEPFLDSENALRAAKRAFEVAEESQTTEDSEVALATFNYGLALLHALDVEKSRKTLKLALKRYTDLYGSDSPKLISPLLMLAQVDAVRRRLGPSQRHLKQARTIVAEAFDKTSIEYADYMYRIGRMALALSFTDAAIQDLRSAHQVYVLKLEPMAIRLGETEHLLGKLYLDSGRIEEAKPLLQAALEIFDPSDPVRLERHIQVRADWGGALESLGLRDEATIHYLAVGRLQESLNTELKPLYRAAPTYPQDALSKGISGYVDWQFTVDESGYVVDPKVTHREGTKSFEKASLIALLKFRYPPRFVDGQAVTTPGVTSQISFMLKN